MQKFMTWMLVASVVTSPSMLQAGGPTKADQAGQKVSLVNVELSKDGKLRGQLVSETGAVVKSAPIRIHSQSDVNKVSQNLRTDNSGNFEVAGLRNGTCVVSLDDNMFACRVWQHGMAPPKSLQSVALVASDEVIRGNNCECGQCAECTGRGCKLGNKIRCMSPGQKIGLGLIVAAAIVLPIVLDDDDAS